MGVEALLAWLEAQTVTPVTVAAQPDVTPEPQQIRGCTSVTPVTAEIDETDAQDFYEERAAIAEYDGGLPRAEAEALAAKALQEWRKQRTYH